MGLLKKLVFLAALIPLLPPAVGLGAEPIVLAAVGDILLGASAAPVLRERGFDHAFEATRELLSGADLAVGNLEAPLTASRDEFREKTFRFKVPPTAAGALQRAGFDVLTLANNHMGDFGPAGVLDTLATLDAQGISRCGAGADLAEARRPVILEVRGEKIAFLAYSKTFPTEFYAGTRRPGTAPGYPSHVTRDVAAARRQADYVVVSFHWGGERETVPKDYQRSLGRLAIDSGAQVVLGHHPHVAQGVERYGEGIIYYSLGNFAFGSYSENSKLGLIARVSLAEGRVASAEVLPVDVYNSRVAFQPRPLEGEAAEAARAEIEALTLPFGLRLAPSEGSPLLALLPVEAEPAAPLSAALSTAEKPL